MRQMKADLTLCFRADYHTDVETWLKNHHYPHLIELCVENDDILLIFNHKSFDKLSDWLDETLSLIDYAKHKDFFKKIDSGILHLNLPFDENHQTADLSFHATHAIVLRQLSVLFDIDYYAYFDVY